MFTLLPELPCLPASSSAHGSIHQGVLVGASNVVIAVSNSWHRGSWGIPLLRCTGDVQLWPGKQGPHQTGKKYRTAVSLLWEMLQGTVTAKQPWTCREAAWECTEIQPLQALPCRESVQYFSSEVYQIRPDTSEIMIYIQRFRKLLHGLFILFGPAHPKGIQNASATKKTTSKLQEKKKKKFKKKTKTNQ